MSSELPPVESSPVEAPVIEPLKKGPPQPGPRRPQSNRPAPPRRDPNERPAPMPVSAPRPLQWGENKPNKRMLDASIEAELDAALADSNILTAFAETEQPKQTPRLPGAKRKGKVVGLHGKDVFIEVPGGRSQGVMDIQQFEDKKPAIGDEVEFDIERFDSANGLLILTKNGAVASVVNWSVVQVGMLVEALVTGLNKNKTGLMVEVSGLKGFMPMSQVDLYRVEQPEAYVNQRIKCEVIELNPEERNLILSRRSILERERQQKAEQFWATISEGKIMKGTVKTVKPFGAFVDLGGADGLIPISEFSWQRVENLDDLIKPGQEVEVMVNRLDFDNRKIGLSLRALQANPFDDFAKNHRPGVRLAGKVTRIMEFGAFVEVGAGIEGLVHISELSTDRIRRVADIVAEGDAVMVQILNIDSTTRRIALSLKAIQADAEGAEAAKTQAEAEADRKEGLDRMANRIPSAENLRGGIGAGPVKFG